MQVTVAGEDAGKITQHISISQMMYGHHSFELRQSMDDRIGSFVDKLYAKTGEMLGKDVEISFGEGNIFKGIITGLSIGRAAKGGSVLIVKGQSPTVALDDGANTLSYYEKSFQAIIDEASKSYKGSFDKAPDYTKKLKYIVQHRESNFNFLVRMSARYGQWFFYDGEKLYLGKKPSGGTTELTFQRDVKSMDLSVRAVPVNFEVHSHDYKVGGKNDHIKKKPEYDVANKYAQIVQAKSQSDIFPETPKSVYNQYTSKEDLDHFVEVHQNAQISEMVFLSAFCTNENLKLGEAVKLVDKREELGGEDDYGEYIITSISHSFSLQGSDHYDYSNQFQAIPKESKIPPMPTSVHPPASEVQMGIVTDVEDKVAMGRVRVKLNSMKGAEKTPLIRCASPYAGKKHGFYMIPEKGDQVLVAFENNNPERPYVLASLHNAEDKPEHFHMENLKKAIKTKGGHEILMNDEKGKEKFSIHSPKDVTINAEKGIMSMTAASNITITSKDGNITITSPKTITLNGKNIIINGKESIHLESPNISANAPTKYSVKSKEFSIQADIAGSIESKIINIEGTTGVNIKGGVVKLN